MAGKTLTAVAVRARSLEWLAPQKTGDPRAAGERHHADLAHAEGQVSVLEALRADREGIVADLRAAGCPAGPATVGIPAGWVLLRVADLPAAAPDELRGMAELQIDKFSPFPAEESAVAYELLAERDGRARVLLSAIRTETVDLLADALRTTGLAPRRIDLNLLGWWRLLADAGHIIHRPPRDGYMAFVKSPDGISVELLQEGRLEPQEPWASMENVGSW